MGVRIRALHILKTQYHCECPFQTFTVRIHKCSTNFAGAPIVMFINIYAGESPIRKTCNFDKPLNHILKVMDGCMHIFCLVKQQNTQN